MSDPAASRSKVTSQYEHPVPGRRAPHLALGVPVERRRGEALTITTPDGTVIVVKVTEIDGPKAFVGIDAPQDFKNGRVESGPR